MAGDFTGAFFLETASAPLTLKPGDGYQAPTGVLRSGKIRPEKTVIAVTFMVEKGEPLACPT